METENDEDALVKAGEPIPLTDEEIGVVGRLHLLIGIIVFVVLIIAVHRFFHH